MNKEVSLQNKAGKNSDYFSREEIDFSKKAAENLRKCPWAHKLLRDSKISRAVQVEKNNSRAYSDLNEIKSALFEIRFAYNIYRLGLPAEYEYSCGIGSSSVDFKVESGNHIWLFELTSLRESLEVKKHTTVFDNYFCYCSMVDPSENSPAVTDIIKVQQAILSKVLNEENKPIKFPVPKDNFIHVILVDMRAFNGSLVDTYDYCNIAFGSSPLISVNQGSCCAWWKDKNSKTDLLIRGLFDNLHPDRRSFYIRERIHILGFVFEEIYDEDELMNKMELFYNPLFFRDTTKSPIFYHDRLSRFLSLNGKVKTSHEAT